MILTDDNIDQNSARYWCLLSDKKLDGILKDIIKKANQTCSKSNAKQTNESVLATAAAEIGFELVAAGVSNYLDTTELTKWKDAVDGLKDGAYLETLDLKHELGRLDDDEFYKLVQASYVVRNYGQSAAKNSAIDRTLGRGYERYDTDAQATNADLLGKSAWKTSPIDNLKEYGFGSYSGAATQEDTKTVEAAFELLSQYSPTQVIAATAVDMAVDGSLMFNKKPMLKNPFSPASSNDDSQDQMALVDGVFINGGVDYSKKNIAGIKNALEDGDLSTKVEDGKILLANGPSSSEDQPQASNASQQDSKEEKGSGKPEENTEQQQAEQAAEQSVKDSPDIKSNSNAVLWIAGAAAAAAAVPYLWKRLKQLADYIKSGKTFAKCQFRCSENGQDYSFEYDLKQKEWKLKFAGSTALKYTPYPSDDEVKSFVKTKFAEKFTDEVEQKLKSLYSAKDKKLLFKAVQAAGKEGSDLIKYLFDNQKAIESSMYKISKYKLWESILKKYKMWESARLQERARH